MPQFAEFGLIRSIRKWDLVAVTVNAVIGAGIFGLPSKVYGLVGSYSLPAVFLCAIFAAMIVLCFAEVEAPLMKFIDSPSEPVRSAAWDVARHFELRRW
jgi:amino acid transporter